VKKLQVKSKIWLKDHNMMLLGEGRVALLLAIDQLGSINKAAKSMEMSYAKAWKLIDSMNTASKQELVNTNSGGTGGGGTVLTDHGKRAITIYQKLNSACQSFLDEELARIIKEEA
jgi:molybdate transport system regulatory protein